MKWKLPTNDDGQRWPLWAGFGIIAVFLTVLYGSCLGSIVPASSFEQATIDNLQTSGPFGGDPLLAPYKLLAWIFLHLPGSDLFNVRSASVVFALACVGLFYGLARRWHGRLVGAATTVLFASTGWMLSTGRHGAGFIMLSFAILALLFAVVTVNKAADEQAAGKAILIFAAAVAIALMTPGGIWFVIAASILLGKQLLGHTSLAGLHSKIGAGAILVASLALFIYENVGNWHEALAIPANLPGIGTLGKQFLMSIGGFLFRGPDMPSVWLARTPLLDVASGTLLLLGVILYAKHLTNSRTRLLLTFAAVGIVLTTLNGAITLGYLVPVAFLIITSGLAYFHHQWRKVFPRNPFAEAFSLAVLGAVLLAAIGFHTQRYFFAWPNNPATVQAYRQTDDTGRQKIPYLIQ